MVTAAGPMKQRLVAILLLALALSAAIVASVALGARASVESTYEFRQIDTLGFLDQYVYTHRFSTDRIKQGEPLELYRRLAHTHRNWCFSSDVYDIHQVGLNFRVAYTPRGRRHPVTGAPLRLKVPYRARAWNDRANDPACVQYHELTGTIPGYESARLTPGCYVMEENWEYGPSPPPTGTQQQESGSLPQFCIDASSPPNPPPPNPPALGPGDFGFSCGTTRYAWHHLDEDPTFVKRGEFACVVLLSNRLSRALIDIAIRHGWDITRAYVSTHRDAIALDAAQFAAKMDAQLLFKEVLVRAFPVAATTIGRLNAIYSAPTLFTHTVIRPLFAAFILRQYAVRGACAQFLVDVDTIDRKRKLRADWSIVYNPRTGGVSAASVWQYDGKRVTRRYAGLRCGINGSVLRGRSDSVFTRPTTQVVSGS